MEHAKTKLHVILLRHLGSAGIGLNMKATCQEEQVHSCVDHSLINDFLSCTCSFISIKAVEQVKYSADTCSRLEVFVQEKLNIREQNNGGHRFRVTA